VRSSKYTRDVLAPMVASARSLSDVIRRLGLPPNGGNHRMIAARIRQANLDTSHFSYGRTSELRFAIARDDLAAIVRDCRSIAQVLRRLGLPEQGRPHRELTARIQQLGLDTSHFRGQGWSRTETVVTHPSVAAGAKRRSFSNDQVFVENSPIIASGSIRRRLLALGWPYRCAWCEISDWRGQPLVLHLDHINGINNDNRFCNLRWLCPNCHSQTATYCNRRR
jgi:hypothetical protein